MTYESMDWPAEVERVRKAFGVSKSCTWEEETSEWANDDALPGDEMKTTIIMRLKLTDSRHYNIDIGDDQFMHCYYHSENRTFQVYDKAVVKGSRFYDMIQVNIDWDGNYQISALTSAKRLTLIRALFFLGLLTPAIESSLQITVTAHQKLEWNLERESRMNTP